MDDPVIDTLQGLANECVIESVEYINGWRVEIWDLTDEAKNKLVNSYRMVIFPDIGDVLNAITEEGIAISRIFLEPDAASPTITRADMVELLAAASMIAVDGAPLHTLMIACVPKASRGFSARGLDIASIHLVSNNIDDPISDGDILFIGSAKHSIAENEGDLRRKLVDSVSDTSLSVRYLGPQLRVLEGRLRQRGIDARRIYGFLRLIPLLDSRHVRIVAVGAVDRDRKSQVRDQMRHLNNSEPLLRTMRLATVPSLSQLHELV